MTPLLIYSFKVKKKGGAGGTPAVAVELALVTSEIQFKFSWRRGAKTVNEIFSVTIYSLRAPANAISHATPDGDPACVVRLAVEYLGSGSPHLISRGAPPGIS